MRDQPPPVPKLPAGTAIDLSDPKFEGRSISLPSVVDGVVVDTGKIISAMELYPATQWPAIAIKRSLLIGYRLTPDGVERAKFPALYGKIPEGTDFVQDMSDRSDLTTRLTYSERSNSFAKAGFNKAALEASCFCASVAAEYSGSHSGTEALKSTVLYLESGLDNLHKGSERVAPMAGLPGVCLADVHGKAGMHFWRVIFSGERDRDDRLPLYWIQYISSGELLAWERQLKNMLVMLPPLLVGLAATDDPTGVGAAALWRIEPADPVQGAGAPNARHIVHHPTRQKLRVMGFCRGELGDDKRPDGGGPSLCDPWRIVAKSKDADWARQHDLPLEKAWRLNAARWILSEAVD